MRTRAGKFMPVESATMETYYLHLNQPGDPHLVLVTEDGTTLQGRQGTEHDSGVVRVVGAESHFARCPQAQEWRK